MSVREAQSDLKLAAACDGLGLAADLAMVAPTKISGHNEMTMKKSQEVPAARFKAECLALLDRVAETGEELIVTKRGRPVARIVPVAKGERSTLLGSVEIIGDITAPIGEEWEVNR